MGIAIANRKIAALLRKRPVLLRTENGLTTDIFVVKYTGRGLVVKRPGVLSKVQILNLVLGVGVFSPLPRCPRNILRKNFFLRLLLPS